MKILKNLDLNNAVFLDIETVRVVDELIPNSPLWDSWEYKMRYSRESEKFEEGSLKETFNKKAALFAEFGKIVCITIGKVKEGKIILKSYVDHDEKVLLESFCKTLNGLQENNGKLLLCGHAIKGFDIPYIMRRCLINGIDLPDLIDVGALKPWEITSIDTMDVWKGSGFYGASLLNIATAFGLPSPKSDISGRETSDVYYGGGEGLNRIAAYCERDVKTVADIVRLCRGEAPTEIQELPMKEAEAPLLERINNKKAVSEKDAPILKERMEGLDAEEMTAAKEIVGAITPKKRK